MRHKMRSNGSPVVFKAPSPSNGEGLGVRFICSATECSATGLGIVVGIATAALPDPTAPTPTLRGKSAAADQLRRRRQTPQPKFHNLHCEKEFEEI
jgi:hypothetical protein